MVSAGQAQANAQNSSPGPYITQYGEAFVVCVAEGMFIAGVPGYS